MQLRFSVGDRQVTFSRSWLTGRATLSAPGEDIALQNPWNPTTHFSFKLLKVWHADLFGHKIVIEKLRPQFLAGFRSQTYRVHVDGQLVAEETGY
ncbi:MAG TPA: hypothetical protein VMD97_07705 [Candidatus Aquilonibacter sp.]|nr:hypothetical protein [Candidatus Aquilonibacter sp.]